MLAERRSSIRKRLRAEQLKAKFALERKTLVEGRLSIFVELAEGPGKGIDYDYNYNMRVLQCAERFPDQENSYILIGNLLLQQPQQCNYFQHFLIDTPRLLKHYIWCLNILLFYFIDSQNSEENEQRLRGVAGALVPIGRDLREINTRKLIWEEALRNIQIMQKLFVQSVTDLLLQAGLKVEELRDNVRDALLLILSFKDPESEQLSNYLKLLMKLKKHWDVVKDHLEEVFTEVFVQMAFSCLKNLPQEREDCISLIQFLLQSGRDCHLMSKLPLKDVLSELLYMQSQIPSLQPSILKLLQSMLDVVRMDELQLFLELGVHVTLTRGISSAMSKRNNSQLQDCLKGLYRLLTNLLEKGETRLLRVVQGDIEAQDFHLMIEGLLNNEQVQQIQRLVNNIVDQFYSQEVENI